VGFSRSGEGKNFKRFYGHSSSKMTDHYIDISGIDLKQDFEVFNPLEKYADRKRKIFV
jgi:hypothetical protein